MYLRKKPGIFLRYLLVVCLLISSIVPVAAFAADTPSGGIADEIAALMSSNFTQLTYPADYIPLGLDVWADGSNTGVDEGTVLETVYGPAQTDTLVVGDTSYSRLPYAPYVVTADNTVVENKDIIGGLRIEAKNVIVRNCRITSNFGKDAMENVNGTGVVTVDVGASAVIINCTIDGSSGTHAGIWHGGSELIALGNNIYNVNDGIFCWRQKEDAYQGNNYILRDNYLHDFTITTANGHVDCFQTEGTKNGILYHNTFDNEYDQTSCVSIWNDYGDAQNILVESNLIAGGGYSVYCQDLDPTGDNPQGGNSITNCRFVNNAFSTKYHDLCGLYGAWFYVGPTDGWNNTPDSGKSYRSGNYVLDGKNAGQNIDSCQPGDIVLPPAQEGEWYCTGDDNFSNGIHTLVGENTGIVTTEFNITPKRENADSAVGYSGSTSTATGWSSLPVIFYLNGAGFFDARNGSSYPLGSLAADTPDDQLPPNAMRYQVDTTYHVRMVMNLYTRTYDVFVTPLDSSKAPVSNPFQVAKNYKFRTGAPDMQDVEKCYTSAGYQNAYIVSGHMVVPGTMIAKSSDNNSAYKLGTANTGDFITNNGSSELNGVVVTKFDIVQSSVDYESSIAYMDGDNDFVIPSGYSAWSRWNMLLMFNRDTDGTPGSGQNGLVEVRNGGGYDSENTFICTPGVKYHMKVAANLKNKTYSVWIAPEGGAETLIADNYAFRTDTPDINDIGTVSVFSWLYDSASAPQNNLLQVDNHTVINKYNFTQALADVNASASAEDMKTAIVSSGLGLSLDNYYLLPDEGKNLVAKAVYDNKGTGYADDLAIQQVIDNSVSDAMDSCLDAAKSAAGVLVQANYTAESWANLTAALNLPEDSVALKLAKYNAINSAIDALEYSYAGTENLFGTKTGSSSNESTAYELGTIFRSSSAGEIKGVRVFAVPGETGNHMVRIWNNTTNTVVGGPYIWSYTGTNTWKTFSLPTPINIEANTDYTVVVSTGADAEKYYAVSSGDLVSAGSNGNHLSWPANAGVYTLTEGALPTSSYNSCNYLRDVIFEAAGSSEPTPVVIKITAKLDHNGNAKAIVKYEDIKSSFDKAVADANGVKTVIIDVSSIKSADVYIVQLPAGAVASGKATERLELSTPQGTVVVPGNMLKAGALPASARVDISVGVKDASDKNNKNKGKACGKPKIILGLKVNGKEFSWKNTSAPVTVTVKYTPTAQELKHPEHIVVQFTDGSGRIYTVTNGKYDAATGKVTFTTAQLCKKH